MTLATETELTELEALKAEGIAASWACFEWLQDHPDHLGEAPDALTDRLHAADDAIVAYHRREAAKMLRGVS